VPTSLRFTFDSIRAASLTGLSDTERQDVFRWLGKQAEELRVTIMLGRFHEFHIIQKANPKLTAPFMDYCALVRSCMKNGWVARKKFRSSNTMTPSDLRSLKKGRLAKAKELSFVKPLKRHDLAVHWGIAVELKNAGSSFRAISRYFQQELKLTVSHMTIWSCWQDWESDRILPGGNNKKREE